MNLRQAAYPYMMWTVVFIAVPLGLIIYFAFTDMQGSLSMDNLVQAGRYSSVFVKSIWLAVVSTVLCLVIGYPVAYLMSRMKGIGNRTLLMLLMLPMWMNFLLRTYAWMTLLENNGIINNLLGMVGIGPLNLINTQGAVVMGMIYNYIPFMIVPLRSVMLKIQNDVLEAAQDLGAGPREVFTKIILPLSKPGIKTGVMMVFVPAVSTFIISQMLGGGHNQLIGDIIEMQFLGNAYNPHLGSAISLVLMLLVLMCMSVSGFLDDEGMEERLL
ncbi:ABC transporter permease [Aminipila butyrica]|uniref:ABC transporter permease n=1 Tax=Aminipila butyrica TaxID=433296 RepID=A0A858BUN3_9FIRM|nr:ABC transporter permease [Aminipila butyrica]QIB68785.1 ABC transporter permease [Aminipila butyrica]